MEKIVWVFVLRNERTSASDFDFALPPLSVRVVYFPQDGKAKWRKKDNIHELHEFTLIIFSC